MNEHAYVFNHAGNARRFEIAAAHEGYDANRIGNIVIAETGAFRAVTDAYTVYEDQAPIWTSDPNVRLPVNSAVTCKD